MEELGTFTGRISQWYWAVRQANYYIDKRDRRSKQSYCKFI